MTAGEIRRWRRWARINALIARINANAAERKFNVDVGQVTLDMRIDLRNANLAGWDV